MSHRHPDQSDRNGRGSWVGRRDWDDDQYWDDDQHSEDDATASSESAAPNPGGSESTVDPPTPPPHSLQTVGRATTPSGSVEVRTTMQGLPTAIRIERSEMDKSASMLAKTLLMLCRQAGVRAGAEHRAGLLADGHTLETVSYLNLPTPRQAAKVDESVEEFFEEYEPGTWMRRV